ncbi:acyl-CoA dehydrogenase family protein [Nocardia paucivorans]|uniref:acyl-CoA dehydrogenase family protein n=1 Tax=Nocardia paucivorans TaxID=114259 RepID=UPI0012F97B1D|nr:acyl-CoA dehydrogenase family protein [Nocardia paucivorans]
MPNVADPTVPKIVVFTARLIVAGRDEGVMLFLTRLRTLEGFADGIEVGELPGKLGAAMDHGWILGRDAFLPRDALLAGDWATITNDGEFVCEIPVRQRFHHAITPLVAGRLDLATGTIATARAAVAGLVNYAAQRPHGDSDALQRDLITAAAHTYVGSVLGRMVRDMSTDLDRQQRLPLWLTVVKPLITTIAQDTLRTCRDRAGAQGHLRCNYLPDWNANIAGAKTAEGETQVLEKTAGRTHHALGALILPGTSDTSPWWLDMIIAREDILADDLYTVTGIDEYEPEGTALGIDSTRVDLARTAGIRLAVTAALITAAATADPKAATVATVAAAVVALTYLDRHGTWYTAHGLQSPEQARTVHTELRRHRLVLAENLPTLAAAFDIPELPGAPIFAPDHLKAWSHRAGWNANNSFPQR